MAKTGRPSKIPGNDTYGTVKTALYIKQDLLQKARNFAYWDRRSLTEALNIIIDDGLRYKHIDKIPEREA